MGNCCGKETKLPTDATDGEGELDGAETPPQRRQPQKEDAAAKRSSKIASKQSGRFEDEGTEKLKGGASYTNLDDYNLVRASLFPLSPHIHISLQSRCPSLSLLALSCCLLLACWVPVHLFWHTRLVNLFFPLRFFSCSNTGRQADRQTERQADRQTGTARLKATPFDRDAKASVAKSTN